jgi:dTDP-4-dehydrorhamnose reductase
MRVLVTGGSGQLGRALVRRRGAHELVAVDVDRLDICDPAQVSREVVNVDVVINAAAYTAVDRAEADRERAFAVNAIGAGNIARACRDRGIRLLHVSTDYVFDGTAARPYREDDPIAPLGAYGETKAAGERAVHDAGGTVVRTSWLFGQGGPSFVHTMLRLARERPVLRVVADQHGCPTWTDHLADALLALAARPSLDATYHYCDEPATTWHAFATAIIDEAHLRVPVEPITSVEYPTPAKRPAYSVLDTQRIAALGIHPRPWRDGVAEIVAKELS